MLPGSTTDCPSRRMFIEEVLPQLDKLKEIVLEEGQHQNGNGNTGTYCSLSCDAVIQWVTSCHKNVMTIHKITFWLVHVT